MFAVRVYLSELIVSLPSDAADYGKDYEDEVINGTGEEVYRGYNVQDDHQCYQDAF